MTPTKKAVAEIVTALRRAQPYHVTEQKAADMLEALAGELERLTRDRYYAALDERDRLRSDLVEARRGGNLWRAALKDAEADLARCRAALAASE